MKQTIQQAVKDISKAKNIVALTGAGISVESGIPPFRGKGGLWEKYDPMEFAHIQSFLRNPKRAWDMIKDAMQSLITGAKPNDGHLGLAKLEEMGLLHTIITQNVDGLHQAAGNTDVIEYHGTFAWVYCMSCNKRYRMEEIDLNTTPPKCACSGILRPDCVFFGEAIPYDALTRSQTVASQCDLMLVIGTSAVVHPAASVPYYAEQNNAIIIEINPSPTPLTGTLSHYIIEGPAGEVMRNIINSF